MQPVQTAIHQASNNEQGKGKIIQLAAPKSRADENQCKSDEYFLPCDGCLHKANQAMFYKPW